MVKTAATKDFDIAISLTEEYRMQLKQECANAEEAIHIVNQLLL